MGQKTAKQEVGALGEEIAVRYFEDEGFRVEGRNYLKKWGEIDIVVRKSETLHFIEVKTVSHLPHADTTYRPEENVHPKKLDRMRRIIQSYLIEKHVDDTDWQFDVVAVFLDTKERVAWVRVTENVVL